MPLKLVRFRDKKEGEMTISMLVGIYIIGLFLAGLLYALLYNFDIFDDEESTEFFLYSIFWPLSIPALIVFGFLTILIFGPYWLMKKKKEK